MLYGATFPILNLIAIFGNVGKLKTFLCSLHALLAKFQIPNFKFQKKLNLILKAV